MVVDDKIEQIVNYCREIKKDWALTSSNKGDVLHASTQNGMVEIDKYSVTYYNMTRRDKLLGLSYKQTKYKNVERVACTNGSLLLFKGQNLLAKIKF